jgi:hypothetical protein
LSQIEQDDRGADDRGRGGERHRAEPDRAGIDDGLLESAECVHGTVMGNKVAHYVAKHYFRRIE